MKDEEIRNGQIIHTDVYGEEYVLDEVGNRMPPLQAKPTKKTNGWTDYDTSKGHCGLCGRLTCPGNCFK